MNFPGLLLPGIISGLFLAFIIFANAQYSYEDSSPSKCGNSTIQYPFGNCGLLLASCINNRTISLTLTLYHSWNVVGNISPHRNPTNHPEALQITTDDYTANTGNFTDTYDWLMMGRFFNLSHGYQMGTIYNCKQEALGGGNVLGFGLQQVDCLKADGLYCYFYPGIDRVFAACTSYAIIVPSGKNYNISAGNNFELALHRGFGISWSITQHCRSCQATGGRCQSYFYYKDFQPNDKNYGDYCACHDGTVHFTNCSDGMEVNSNIIVENLKGYRQGNPPSAKPTVGNPAPKKASPNPMVGYLPAKNTSPKHMAAIISTVIAVSSIAVVSCIMVRRRICYKRTCSEEQSIREFMDPLDSTPQSVENFLNYYSSQVPTRYSYSQITAYTNNLADKVGKGGFGTVYKGKLPNGHLIAVKILDESKQSEQQFMAEVATVGRTYHVNLVRLLGYCSQGSKRALVYEYMVNGSLDKYVHGAHEEDELELDWKQLYSIAVGTARGIAYLHQDCKNRILHCDIKPHNILLDADFCPKVADFGLAKISDRGESHISVANRGTLGYAAPEMWSRMYGSVTDRSDVYSYGILVMEMVGGRKNMDFDERESRSSRFFYTEWAFKQVEKGAFGNLRKGTMSEEDQSIAKKLSLIGLWCIQFKASSRPSMCKVIQVLEGDVDIATPPCPVPFDTPLQLPISDQSSSTNTLEIQMINATSTQPAKNSRLKSLRRAYSCGSTLGDQ